MRMTLLAGCVLLASGALAAAEMAAPKVAVVDITRVFNEYKKTARINQLMEENFQARRDELQKRQQQIVEKENALRNDARPPDDPAALKERQELGYEKVLLERDMRLLRQEIANFNLEHTNQIMAEMAAAVRRYAERKGLDLVLKYQPAQTAARSDVELSQQIGANPVLYFAAALDISGAIISLLNEAYDRGISLVPRERAAEAGR